MEEAKMLQARLQEEEVECILYEQGKKDIHGNLLKGVGIAVPKSGGCSCARDHQPHASVKSVECARHRFRDQGLLLLTDMRNSMKRLMSETVTVQVPLKATLQKIDKMATLELR